MCSLSSDSSTSWNFDKRLYSSLKCLGIKTSGWSHSFAFWYLAFDSEHCLLILLPPYHSIQRTSESWKRELIKVSHCLYPSSPPTLQVLVTVLFPTGESFSWPLSSAPFDFDFISCKSCIPPFASEYSLTTQAGTQFMLTLSIRYLSVPYGLFSPFIPYILNPSQVSHSVRTGEIKNIGMPSRSLWYIGGEIVGCSVAWISWGTGKGRCMWSRRKDAHLDKGEGVSVRARCPVRSETVSVFKGSGSFSEPTFGTEQFF